MRRFASHFEIDYDWPTSLCHGWGAGAVPFATRLLMGIQPLKPGYRSVSLNPCLEVPWSYQASVPTPWGPIRIERGGAGEVPFYRIPREIEVEASASGVRIEHG